MAGERDVLKWIRARARSRRGPIVVDTGDDAAVLKGGIVLKVDSVIEGVHFVRGTAPERIGRKAMARPLSDIAAMGAVSVAALVAAVVPRSWSLANVKRLHRGLESLRVPIVGGDFSTHRGPLTLSVTILGDMKGAAPVLRKGAKPGDLLLVTGALGGSIRGQHLSFTPRLNEGRLFATRRRVHAMIDISDGLARDLGHLCAAGGVGAELVATRIPISRGSTLDGALHDGEDYELLAAADSRTAWAIEQAGKGTVIGRVLPSRGLWLVRRDGSRRPLKPEGYEHPLK